MAFGSNLFGVGVFGTHKTAVEVPPPPPPPSIDELVPDLSLATPTLLLWELVGDTSTVRFVDFGSNDGSAVTFDGNTYTPVHIGTPQLETATDGRFPNITVTVSDFDYTVINFVIANNNLENAKVNLRIIDFADIDDPSLAQLFKFRVKEVSTQQGPNRVSITFGQPDIFELSFPRILFNRALCHNNFERRFIHDGLNYCSYPSDEFEEQTGQKFAARNSSGTVIDTVTELDHGWFSVNSTKLDSTFTTSIKTPVTRVDDTYLSYILAEGEGGSFASGAFQAPYIYKEILDTAESDRVVDVTCKLRLNIEEPFSTGTPTQTFGLMFIQPENDPDEFVAIGFRFDTTNQFNLVVLEGTDSPSTNVTVIDSAPEQQRIGYRIQKTEGTTHDWKFYSRIEPVLRMESEDDWLLEHTITDKTMTGTLRVGFTVATTDEVDDVPEGTLIELRVHHLRFLAGGFKTCDRTVADCTERKNLIQRNGYLGLPDKLPTF